MYKSTQEFNDRLAKIGSQATEPNNRLTHTQYYGDKKRELYDSYIYLTEQRKALNAVLKDVIAKRKATPSQQERTELYRLEHRIEAMLRASKMTKPDHNRTFSQCFMNMAEQMLRPDVFKEIFNKTHDLYHHPDNVKSETAKEAAVLRSAGATNP